MQVLALYGTCNHATNTKVSMKQHVYSLKIFEGKFASQLFFGVKRIVPLKIYETRIHNLKVTLSNMSIRTSVIFIGKILTKQNFF